MYSNNVQLQLERSINRRLIINHFITVRWLQLGPNLLVNLARLLYCAVEAVNSVLTKSRNPFLIPDKIRIEPGRQRVSHDDLWVSSNLPGFP